ncbi:sulfite exporter TauE/SafE family protein [Siminovitchia acidinfaciens]|uniref:Probable membrane transporter protein n=1 Tax=Siminovitchia acidinfaciens TaxID=2321395 RepID=A0A429Y051_9BACI|nr:sulfite exporter TauE/SafE family protein [Siminovitchia acidinfaciens]RST74349.1 sulfite exporter TauE/SafE family protein [Siminovitchia acidinfaciens]
MGAIYFLVGLLASIIGAVAGIGGGIIIKPALDLLSHYDPTTIGILSSSTVFMMAAVSLLGTVKSGLRVEKRTSLILAAGSVIGGIVGQYTFDYLIKAVHQDAAITFSQSGMLAFLMLVIFFMVKNKEKMNTYRLHQIFLIILIGFGLGMIGAFLGIGGGPLNIAVLTLAFSMGTKEAAANSIFIIFFSQLSSLMLVWLTEGFAGYDLSSLVYMLAGGAIGGLIGSFLSNNMPSKWVDLLFQSIIIMIFFVNIFNMLKVCL